MDTHASDAHTAQLPAETRAALVREITARVRAELAAAPPPPRGHPRRPRRALAVLLAALLLVTVPLATRAAIPFNDLSGGVHDANIGLIYDAGITRGCVPNVSYCPTANVTREEMASFLARTAGLGTNPPVVNAKTAQTAGSATNAMNATNAAHATSADTATNAAQLGGQPASAYARTAALLTHQDVIVGGGTFPREGLTFTATGTRGLLIVSGSAYRTSPGFLRVDVLIVPVGQSAAASAAAFVYADANSHRALITGLNTVPLTPGTTYRFITTADPGTTLNSSDYIESLLLELP